MTVERASPWQEEEAEGGPGWATVGPPPQLPSLRPQNCQLSWTRQAPGSTGRGLRSPFPTLRPGDKAEKALWRAGSCHLRSLPSLPSLEAGPQDLGNNLSAFPNSPPGSCPHCSFGRRCQGPPAEARSETTGTACRGGSQVTRQLGSKQPPAPAPRSSLL